MHWDKPVVRCQLGEEIINLFAAKASVSRDGKGIRSIAEHRGIRRLRVASVAGAIVIRIQLIPIRNVVTVVQFVVHAVQILVSSGDLVWSIALSERRIRSV